MNEDRPALSVYTCMCKLSRHVKKRFPPPLMAIFVLSCRVSKISEFLQVRRMPLFRCPSSIPVKSSGCFPWSRSVMLRTVECEPPKLSNRKIFSKNSILCVHDTSTLRTDRLTDSVSYDFILFFFIVSDLCRVCCSVKRFSVICQMQSEPRLPLYDSFINVFTIMISCAIYSEQAAATGCRHDTKPDQDQAAEGCQTHQRRPSPCS